MGRSSAVLNVVILTLLSCALLRAQGPEDGSRSRGLLWGYGHSWGAGWPGYGKTESDIAFLSFHPQMGWFVSDSLELYGEGSLLYYLEPTKAVAGGLVGLAGRWHWGTDRPLIPYLTLGSGLVWTTLDEVPEVDRTFNFQVIWGAGLRLRRANRPGLIVEFRNHHISNAGTAGNNLGINAATVVFGLDWILR